MENIPRIPLDPMVQVENVPIGEQRQDEAPQHPFDNDRPLMAIESYEHFVERNGLTQMSYGMQSERNLEERRIELQKEADYQQNVHKAIFGAQETSENTSCQLLASIADQQIDIETAKDGIQNVSLKALAETCDTVLTLAAFQHYQHKEEQKRLSFSLKSFQHEAVVEFVEIVLGDKKPEDVSSDYVVECCEIARYMQCTRVLEAMVDILVRSIDDANCMYLCQLADQLDLPRLFENSMAQMIQSVGSLQQHEVWDDFSPDLKRRIMAMEAVMKSSIHDVKNRLYFSSMTEYLSIFAENVQYYRERLAEAKERQAEEPEPPRGHSWQDAQAKIDRQEKRVKTLEVVFQEQKKLFDITR